MPPGVHDAIGNFHRAYAVFEPQSGLELFQGVLIGEGDDRHKSPVETALNLASIVDDAKDHEELRSSSHETALDKLEKEMRKVVPPNEEPMRTITDEREEAEASISTYSLNHAVLAGLLPSTGSTLGGKLERRKHHAISMKLQTVLCRAYTGGYLPCLIWDHGKFLFRRMLLYLNMQLTGPRHLLGFVTKRWWATASVTSSKGSGTKAGFAGPIPLAACFGCARQKEALYKNTGVTGIHMFLFPVERRGDFKWRFFPPIWVQNAETSEVDQKDPFSIAKRWVRGEADVQLSVSTHYMDVTGPAPKHCPSKGEEMKKQASAPGGESAKEELHHGSKDEEVVPDTEIEPDQMDSASTVKQLTGHVDIDIANTLVEFADEQCELAKEQKIKNCLNTDKLAFQMFKSSAKLGNSEALYELADMYSNGIGTEVNENAAEQSQMFASDPIGNDILFPEDIPLDGDSVGTNSLDDIIYDSLTEERSEPISPDFWPRTPIMSPTTTVSSGQGRSSPRTALAG